MERALCCVGEISSFGFLRRVRVCLTTPLTLVPDSSLPAHTEPLPQQLNTIIRPLASDIVSTRDFMLSMEGAGEGADHGHGTMNMTINGAAMNMNVINEHVQKGVWERWRIRSDVGAHPFHVHGCSFLIE